MTEKEAFIDTLKREFATTSRVLAAYPDDKLDIKPNEKSKSARDLAWTLANATHFIDMAISGNFDFSGGPPPAPKTIAEMITSFKAGEVATLKKVEAMSDADFGKMVKFFVAPKQMGDVPRGGIMWGGLYDHIHHRGQFSVYLRAAGAKVPSIYGPTADEPWM
jgi:uncharacterized damage-inducible protein DinB